MHSPLENCGPRFLVPFPGARALSPAHHQDAVQFQGPSSELALVESVNGTSSQVLLGFETRCWFELDVDEEEAVVDGLVGWGMKKTEHAALRSPPAAFLLPWVSLQMVTDQNKRGTVSLKASQACYVEDGHFG